MNPLISVIVPVYNVEKYLNKCIESIVNQTYKNLEIILVDDGSTDNCPQICDAWAEKDSRIKVIHKQNGGVSSARNEGMDFSAGDYIAFIDPDDYILLNMYEKMYNAMKENDCDIVICNLFSDGRIVYQYPNAFLSAPNITPNYLKGCLCHPGVPGKLYNKNVINNLKFDVTKKIAEDFLFNYYVFKNANRVLAISDKLYNYFNREDSAVNRLSEAMTCRWKTTKELLETDQLDENDYYSLLNFYCRELLRILRELIESKDKQLINAYFYEITDEIKSYSKRFLNDLDIGKIAKLYIKCVCMSPALFKFLYTLYSYFRKDILNG